MKPSPNHELRKACDRRVNALREVRFSWFARWQDLSLNIDPKRGSFNVTAAGQKSKGTAKDQKIKDSTARDALRTLQSGLMSGATSPARPWFKLTLDDSELAELPPVMVWCAEVQKRMLRVMAESNVYHTLHNTYGDLGLFGVAGFLLLEDFEDVVRAYPLVVGEFLVGLDERLAVNTLYREFSKTVFALVQEFGIDNVSPDTKLAYERGEFDRDVDVIHGIEPNDKRVLHVADAKGMKFREVYYEKGTNADAGFLAIRGHRSFPALVPRWDVNGSDPYGSSPGMDALPDVKQLASETVWKGKAIGKQIDPPMTAPASMKNEPATMLPGGVTFVAETNGQGFKPAYQPTTRLADLTADIEGVKKAVKVAFHADLFFAISQMEGVQPRNNMEIAERRDEKLVMLGPVLERLHGELLGPLIVRVYDLMEAAGLIPPRPPEMGEVRPKIEFVSVLAQAQKSLATAGIERFVQFIGFLSDKYPEAGDKVEIMEVIDEYAELINVGPKLVATNEKAEKRGAARAKAMQAKETAEAAPDLAATAETLSKIDVGGGASALQRMTGAV